MVEEIILIKSKKTPRAISYPKFLPTTDMDPKIRIPGHIWNAYAPMYDQPKPTGRRQNHTNRFLPTKTMKLKVRIPAHIWNAYALTDDRPKVTERKSVTRAPKSCKTKLSAFQFGGPARKQRGKHMNDVSLAQPCFEPTCANCLKNNRHGIQEDLSTRASKHAKRVLEEPATSGAPVRMMRAMSRQQQRIVQLLFKSQRGRRRFTALVRRYERRERRGE